MVVSNRSIMNPYLLSRYNIKYKRRSSILTDPQPSSRKF